ncbi:MAG: hypothetical protein LRZ88_06290 [Candidatus Cloacimonetes bacterium]|nr:hypothetical protein [Candidatus Cloacimonadota bacterium]
MDINGLGSALISRLVELGLLSRISDIYKLEYADLTGLERMGEKSATNLINAIAESKNRNFDRSLFRVGYSLRRQRDGSQSGFAFW